MREGKDEPAFAAALPTADLQEEVEGLARRLRDTTTCAAAQRVARDAIALARRLATPLPEWQPIESAPRDGRAVLLWWPGAIPSHYPIRGFWSEHPSAKTNAGWATSNYERASPTHWMPLPSPPQAEVGGPLPKPKPDPKPWRKP